MEVEVRARTLVMGAIVVVLALAGLLVLTFSSGEKERAGGRAPVRAAAAPTPTAAPRVRVVVENRSEEWEVHGLDECLPKLRSWLERRGYPLRSVTLVVTDTVTPEMAVSTVWPDPRDAWPPTHEVSGVCRGDPASPECVLAVEKGEPGPTLALIASVELANVVYDFYRPRRQGLVDENGRIKEWGWELFTPLIEKQEDGTWRSACISLSRR